MRSPLSNSGTSIAVMVSGYLCLCGWVMRLKFEGLCTAFGGKALQEAWKNKNQKTNFDFLAFANSQQGLYESLIGLLPDDDDMGPDED